jgi:hypothetical protein
MGFIAWLIFGGIVVGLLRVAVAPKKPFVSYDSVPVDSTRPSEHVSSRQERASPSTAAQRSVAKPQGGPLETRLRDIFTSQGRVRGNPLFDILYSDAGDNPTERRISIRRITRFGQSVYVEAFCHLRQADRSFRVDRIKQVSDPDTGEVANIEFATIHAGDFPEPQPGGDYSVVMSRARPGLNALIWLARADYDLSDAEMDLLLEFVELRASTRTRGAPLADWNRDVVRRWIENAKPTMAEASGRLLSMSKTGEELKQCQLFAARLVHEANFGDGQVLKRAKRLGLVS